jgi:tetrahydromethanopterin S-methyltransferase subunit G
VDFGEGIDPIASVAAFRKEEGMARLRVGTYIGLMIGCLVVGVLLFMMFAILGGLLSGGQ